MAIDPTTAKVAIRIPSWISFGREIFRGIASYLSENQLRWRIDAELSADNEVRPTVIGRSWKGDGAIFFRYSAEEADKFAREQTPLIAISRVSSKPWVPRVHADNVGIGKLAAKHLIATGSPNIYCHIDPNRPYSIERLFGFREFAQHHHRQVEVLECPASTFPDHSKWENIHDTHLELLKSVKLPAAIFARDDIGAVGLMRAAEQLNIKIPDQLMILGVGDDPILTSVTAPDLSSIVIPGTEIGWQAAKQLHQRMRGECPPFNQDSIAKATLIKVSNLTQRESTNHLHVNDPVVLEACQIVKLQANNRGITVKELTHLLDVSETTLLKKFQYSLATSPKKFIDKCRHIEAARLLRETDWPIKQISYQMNFSSPEEFDRFFKRLAQISPSQYRDQCSPKLSKFCQT